MAQRTGAARFEEYLDDDSFSSHEGKLKKRLAVDTDVLEHNDNDYEVYQGVLGRPGVDFPVMTGIPKTNFNCKEFGNGYFADLDTSCQVCSLFVQGLDSLLCFIRFSTSATRAAKSPSSAPTEQFFVKLI